MLVVERATEQRRDVDGNLAERDAVILGVAGLTEADPLLGEKVLHRVCAQRLAEVVESGTPVLTEREGEPPKHVTGGDETAVGGTDAWLGVQQRAQLVVRPASRQAVNTLG